MQYHLYPFVPRRSEREITEAQHLRALLHAALVGRVGVIAQGEPYIVPMNFAYEQREGTLGKIILHGAGQGRLFQALEGTPVVCFEIDASLRHFLILSCVSTILPIPRSSVGDGYTK